MNSEVKRLAKRARTALLAFSALLAVSQRTEAWGFLAHRMVNRKAIDVLPEPLRGFFAANAAFVQEHAIDPDLWRTASAPGENPNHFLDMDDFGMGPIPQFDPSEAHHLARFGKDAVEKGRLPWRVGEVYRELVGAFRARDFTRALERAAVLGHYVGDAHVPLHAVTNYDGQLTGQTGVHNRWESDLVERFERQLEEQVRPPEMRRLGDPVEATLAILGESLAASAAVLESDRALTVGKDLPETSADERFDDSYYSRLYEREAERLTERLARASAAVGSLWFQAWEEAGRPEIDPSFRIPYVRKASRAVLISLDGSPSPLIDDAVSRGIMPHLARLRARGAVARGSLTSLPSKTASGHAALFTGAWSDANGITGNDVPVAGASILEANNGYSSTPLRAEPIWVAAARQGLRVTVVSAPQVYPFGPYLQERRFGGDYGRSLTLFDGYQNADAEDRVYTARDLPLRDVGIWLAPLPAHDGDVREIEIELGGTRIDGLVYGDPSDPAKGFDTLYLGLDRDPGSGITLKPLPANGEDPAAFAALPLAMGGGEAALYFRLFSLAADGSQLLLYRTAPQIIRSSRPRLERPAYEAARGFVGNGAGRAYERGELGAPLWEGGDGTAERRYLETVALVTRQLTRLTDFALEGTAWDLLLTYLPYPDEALHVWFGYLDPALPGHDAALASRLRPHMDRVLSVVDEYVGHISQRAAENTIVAVGADHGMFGATRVVKPNLALAAAGILALDSKGRVDLARSTAVYFPGNSGYVLINRVGREGGIVKPEEEEAIRRRVVATLKAIRDPWTGKPIVLDVLDGRGKREPAIGGPTGGDLYLSLAPGYDLSAQGGSEVVEKKRPRGVHSVNPERPDMHAAFALAGPGVAAGADLGVIRQIDIAPTLCALLGIGPPLHATGRVLEKALSRPASSGVARAR